MQEITSIEQFVAELIKEIIVSAKAGRGLDFPEALTNDDRPLVMMLRQ
jgi:hypothetical protein